MVRVPPLALLLRLTPVQQLHPRILFPAAHHFYTEAMPPVGSRSQGSLPECLERPQFERHSIGGANYRLLRIPAAAASLNRAEWSQEAFDALISGRSSGTVAADEHQQQQQQQQQNRRGAESDLSVHSTSSESEESETHDSSGEVDIEARDVVSMSEEEIQQQQEALEDEFVAACAATQEEESRWRIELRMPGALFRRLTRKGPSNSPLYNTLHALGVSYSRPQKVAATRGHEMLLSLWGPTEKRVCLAKKKAEELAAKQRRFLPVSHFISLPLSTPEVKSRFEVYRHLVLASNYPTIDESLFVSKDKLHITLLVLRLLNAAEVQAAAQVLKAAAADIYDAVATRTVLLHVKGNNCFTDDPSDVSVVFAPLYSRCVYTVNKVLVIIQPLNSTNLIHLCSSYTASLLYIITSLLYIITLLLCSIILFYFIQLVYSVKLYYLVLLLYRIKFIYTCI